jgi:hypothetical protein
VFDGAVLFFFLIHAHVRRQPLYFGAAFAVVSALEIYVLFNVTWVHNQLTAGYLLFFPLLILPLLILAAHEYRPLVFAALLLIVLPPQFYWSAKWIIINSGRTLDPIGFVTPNTWISRQYLDGPPVRIAGGFLISPFRWEEKPGETY